ncbi:MAG: hypothetical protein Fur0037_00540 [Planctomycetota bacterium]
MESGSESGRGSPREWLSSIPRWQWILLGAAVSAMAIGGVWMLVQQNPAPSVPPEGGSSLLPGGAPPAAGPAPEPAARGVFRLGFSFVAGFCLGAFLRATLRVAAIAFGFWLLATFLLSFYGLVEVHWARIDELWSRFWSGVGDEWTDFQRFVTGSLPAAGLAVLGLALGLRRR